MGILFNDREEPQVTQPAASFKRGLDAIKEKEETTATALCSDEELETASPIVHTLNDKMALVTPVKMSCGQSYGNAVETPEQSSDSRGFHGTKTLSVLNEQLHRVQQARPQVNKRFLQNNRQLGRTSRSWTEPLETCCHRETSGLEMIGLVNAKCDDFKFPKSKRRVRKQKIQSALRSARTITLNKSPPKRIIKCGLIEKTRRKKVSIRKKIVTHTERRSRIVTSSTIQSIRRTCRKKLARAQLCLYLVPTMVQIPRFNWPESSGRMWHRRFKHRWKQKTGLSWCGQTGRT